MPFLIHFPVGVAYHAHYNWRYDYLMEILKGLSHWIGLDLFNDDTRPSGHISRPTQVNDSELLSFSKQLLKSNNIVQSGG